MSRLSHRSIAAFFVLFAMVCCCSLQAAQSDRATTAPTRPSTSSTATNSAYGPDVVVLDELVDSYEAVPFEHRVHAEMAEMWDGCETCHHHTPAVTPPGEKPAPRPAEHPAARHSTDEAVAIPACKSCHSVSPSTAEIEMPSLKGAYHRQCLNCHREWMGSNACVICHATREGASASRPTTQPPSPDDITGRMHKPLTPPTEISIKARYAPVDGRNVLLRHEEHTEKFGVKCVACHRRDSCGDCHSSTPATAQSPADDATTPSRLLKPSMTWRESHQPCISCHEQDKCGHCHYQAGEEPPPAFRHEMTGQALDANHVKLACGQCHEHFKTQPALTCAAADCHHRPVSFPKDRPGRYTAPVAVAHAPAARNMATAPDSKPTTRPMIIRIRRGVQQ